MNARQAALEIVSNVLKNKSYLNLESKRVLSANWSAEDKRFITALANTTIENLFRIDYVLKQFITAKRVHAVIMNILRIGACQLLFFESVPASAAVNESVKLVEKVGKRQLKGFVNATLRNLSKNLGKISYPDRETDLAEFLHIFYSYPKWLCEKYLAEYGEQQTEQMLSFSNDHSLTCVRKNLLRDMRLPENFSAGKYLEDAFYIKNASSIEKMPLFTGGGIAVQGEASMLCVHAAGIGTQDRVLDACAAPGGKSAYASQFASGGQIVSMELYPHRAKLIEETFERLGVANAQILVQDASKDICDYHDGFDVVMVDAPCSALGLLYRKPDIKILKQKEDIPPLVKTQRAILEACASYVKKGGTLLYSTCTIDRAENEDNMEWFLKGHPEFVMDEPGKYLPEKLSKRLHGGMLQLFPHIDGIDGFFIARLKRI